MMTEKKREPDWAHRAEHIPHKPEWVDGIPHLLWELGDVFFPIPSGRKGWGYPHHVGDFRHLPDSEELNAYLEAGFGYGIACANNLAVVDIDEKEYVEEVTSHLPETVYQVTGSREGVHLFYKSPGMNSRQILHYSTPHDCSNADHKCVEDDEGDCTKMEEWSHLGEVKCDPHGYVIGPGSLHPSGNIYGPLKGDKMAEVSKENLLDSLDPFIKPKEDDIANVKYEYVQSDAYSDPRYGFYSLEATDVLPWLSSGNRVAHPVHGSSSGSNFMLNNDGQTFMCWRHDYGSSPGCGLNAQQFLAQSEAEKSSNHRSYECDEIRRQWNNNYVLHWLGWRKAVEDGHIQSGEIPYKVALGYGVDREFVDGEEDFRGEVYWDVINALKYETFSEPYPEELYLSSG